MRKTFCSCSVGLLCCVIFLSGLVNCFTADADVSVHKKNKLPKIKLFLEEINSSNGGTDNNSSGATQIVLNGSSISVNGSGANVDGSKVTITSAGTYSISGTLADGQIIVDTADAETVTLILNGVNIRNSSSAGIYVISGEEIVITLADNTENYVSDGASYIFEDAETDEPNAAIFSKSDLRIEGNGSLTVSGNYNDAIASKDGLTIRSGTITVNAADDGIRGKDYVVVKEGTVTVKAGGDGLKSDNEEDVEKGYISVESGVINITAGGDAFDAQTDVAITGGKITLSSGGGSNSSISGDTSAKGIKGVVSVIIDGGDVSVNSADDAIHSNGSIIINGGAFNISSGDDAVHADASVEISGGDFNITKSYEGIESAVITINDGDIRIVSSDDGINVAGGNDASGMNVRPGQGGRPGQDTFATSGNYWLYINGGYIAVNAAGDGIDVNGSVLMTGGDVIVNGPTNNGNGALDYDGSFNISGGFLVAAGSSGMAQAPGATSSQNSLLMNFNTSQRAGSLVHIQTADGRGILTFAPSKTYQSIVFSSPELIKGSAYNVYLGSSSSGTPTDGLYQGGTYTPGTKYSSFTVSGVVTKAGNAF